MSWLRDGIEGDHRDEVEQLRSQVAGAGTHALAVRRQAPAKTSLALLLLVVVVAWAGVHFGIKSLRAYRAQTATAVGVAQSAMSVPLKKEASPLLSPSRTTTPQPTSAAPAAESNPRVNSAAGMATTTQNARNAAPLGTRAVVPDAIGKQVNALRPPPATRSPKIKPPAPDTAATSGSQALAAAVPDGPGDKELRTGRQYLTGDGVPKNSAEGAKWLWKAVAARNTTAEMALAELYARGEGVAKNCEQAKILLDSAAKRGVEAAGAQLKQWSDSGCQ